MSEWRAYHVYYADLDRLVLECVHPLLERVEGRLERRFWERRFAGGPHLRVRIRGEPATVAAAGAELVREAERFVAEHPSPDVAGYSPERAAALLRKEGEEPEAEDLRYRNNTVEAREYRRPPGVYASDEAAAMADDFRHDSLPVAARIVGGERPKAEALLRLFFLQALVVCRGDLPAGCVSCRSHWEGFAASFPAREVVERIRETERRNRPALAAALREVEEAWAAGTVDADPVLGPWRALLEAYRARTRAALERGTALTLQPETPEEARAARERMFTFFHGDSEFVRTFWADERFIASLQHEPAWLVPRVLTNLLYQLVGTVGLGPIDRMALCHYAYRAAEEVHGCDLGEILKGSIERTVAANAGRWEG